MTHQYIGTHAWASESRGTLSLRDRLTLVKQSLAPSLSELSQTWLKRGSARAITLEQIPFPDTVAVRSALAELEGCARDVVIQHSLRTYYWGAALGLLDHTDFEPEFLLVGCLLHDLGMTDKHHGQHNCDCFAIDGARAAATWAAKIGWPAEKQVRLGEMISLHMNGPVDISHGGEAHLLQVGAACDVIGARFYELAASYRDDILQQHPRLGLNQAFIDFMAKEAALRPASRSALMRLSGLPLLIRMNPFPD